MGIEAARLQDAHDGRHDRRLVDADREGMPLPRLPHAQEEPRGHHARPARTAARRRPIVALSSGARLGHALLFRSAVPRIRPACGRPSGPTRTPPRPAPGPRRPL
ncbi:MAG: hypothetical protein MZV64_13825 [Ignavibacteriales bacterium]|nr:hypothetical protein [Ignavibacteriales bacterium]